VEKEALETLDHFTWNVFFLYQNNSESVSTIAVSGSSPLTLITACSSVCAGECQTQVTF